ncbi:MAG: EAL domain-containing protein [Peptostreptococcaceae bacterium]|nr:EAL domain-containing protein [Peptostreptococcaceae bacterium]
MDLILNGLDKFYRENDVSECLQRIISITNPSEAIEDILDFLGEKCSCGRVYIFEHNGNDTISNTYEWCAEGVSPQKDLLQNEPIATIRSWWQVFQNNDPVMIKDLEDIKESHPELYAGLKPQDIRSLVAAPIRLHDELIGFLGVDDPKEEVDPVASMLFVAGNFISFIIERRDLMKKLEYLSYHDQLTGALNRHAYGEGLLQIQSRRSLGVVYCDISELKKTNDNLGHDTGDRLILCCYELLKNVFSEEEIYRVGGDEFIVICSDQSEKKFEHQVTKLRSLICQNECHMAVGSVWSNEMSIDVEAQVKKAEKAMYRDKSRYYSQRSPVSVGSGDRRRAPRDASGTKGRDVLQGDAADFFESNYFDPAMFFRSIAMSDYYPYVGDLSTNLFYISDEMRDAFGFTSNQVSDLLGEWEKRITDSEELALYRQDISEVLSRKKDLHDLRYRVKDKDGNDIWIHCRGMIKWNEDGTRPLFFSGGISRQVQNFVIDPVTNFPREYVATMKIRELQKRNEVITIIGFTLNNFSEVNELRGRHAADTFLREISRKLIRYFETKMTFYRLDGMRFIAIVASDCEESVEQLIQRLKEIISALYYSNNIVVRIPCSVGVICETGSDTLPQDMLLNMISLLSTAKNSSEAEFVVHSPVNIHLQRTKTQMSMELNKNVVDGLENFRIVVQPTVSADDFRITSGEVLLRWQFEGKDVPPSIFIPMLENNHLILPVGKWVFEQAVRTCKRITTTYLSNFKLAVNVSYYQILDPDFLPFMERTLQKYNLNGNRLILEITETHYDETPTKVFEFVENCKKLGMGVAIDDFGNGYSSLAFLLKYPANIVKLDRSLINEMVTSKDNINFISSIVYACHKFGKKVCAEGVETEAELEIIRGAECDMIQGYYFYKPLELRDFYRILPEEQDKQAE